MHLSWEADSGCRPSCSQLALEPDGRRTYFPVHRVPWRARHNEESPESLACRQGHSPQPAALSALLLASPWRRPVLLCLIGRQSVPFVCSAH